MITGSGGLTLANYLQVPFVQEVIAVSTSLQELAPVSYTHLLAKIRIAVRSDIGISALSEAAHAAVSAALDADCIPEIIRI